MRPLISKWTMVSPYVVSVGDGHWPSSAIPADTVFAALLAAAPEQADRLLEGVRAGALRLSDALPREGEMLFLPSRPGEEEAMRQSGRLRRLPGRIVPAGHRRGIALEAPAGLYVVFLVEAALQPVLEEALAALAQAGIGAERSLGCGRLAIAPLRALTEEEGEDAQALAAALAPTAGPVLSLAAAWPEDGRHLAECRGDLYVKARGPLPSRALAAGFTAAAPFAGVLLETGEGAAPYVRYLHPLFREVPRG